MSDTEYGGYALPDLSDTGQWRLVVSVAADGVSAALRAVDEAGTRPLLLFRESWTPEESSLLHRIETAVYDHPRLLDDFATEIVVTTSRALWVPAESLDTEGAEEELFTCVYPASPEDIHVDVQQDMACLYTLVPGLSGFLSRTMPGARIRSHQTLLHERFSRQASGTPRLYADIRDGEADFMAFDGRQLLCAATAPWRAPADAGYRLFLMADTYGLDISASEVHLSGRPEARSELAAMLRKTGVVVMIDPEPPAVAELGMSLAPALALARI